MGNVKWNIQCLQIKILIIMIINNYFFLYKGMLAEILSTVFLYNNEIKL